MRSSWIALTLLSASMLGCGGLGGSGALGPARHAGASIAKQRYLREANAICARYQSKLDEMGQPSGSIKAQAAHARRLNALSRHEFKAVQRLDEPQSDRRLLAAMFRDVERALSYADVSTRAITTDVASANVAAERAFRGLDDVNRRLTAYGLTICGK